MDNPHTETTNAYKILSDKQLSDKRLSDQELKDKMSAAGTTEKRSSHKPDESVFNEIIGYLNSTVNANYRSDSKATRSLISARLREGYTAEDFKTVIDKKSAEWNGTDMAQYLRPSTLFGNKFESYLNAPASANKNRRQSANTENPKSADMIDLLNAYLEV